MLDPARAGRSAWTDAPRRREGSGPEDPATATQPPTAWGDPARQRGPGVTSRALPGQSSLPTMLHGHTEKSHHTSTLIANICCRSERHFSRVHRDPVTPVAEAPTGLLHSLEAAGPMRGCKQPVEGTPAPRAPGPARPASAGLRPAHAPGSRACNPRAETAGEPRGGGGPRGRKGRAARMGREPRWPCSSVRPTLRREAPRNPQAPGGPEPPGRPTRGLR